ncbi:hypothetical protein [Saliphagus sp. LR7]|uniref:hypothetical protein n=1 Tax=Saliphagus sp. LR7 TaxID=2282654 RepID=UPI001300AB04|nr:hypothetical protein [Saliphagus sp. LR7]
MSIPPEIITWLNIMLTAAIPAIPVGKRIHFVKKANRAIDKLTTDEQLEMGRWLLKEKSEFDMAENPSEEKFSEDVKYNTLHRGEPGFEQLDKSLRKHGQVENGVRKYGLAAGQVRQIAEPLAIDIYEGNMSSNNYMMYAEYDDGSFGRVVFHPNDPETTRILKDVKNWVRETAVIESEAITVFLVFTWAIYNIILIG